MEKTKNYSMFHFIDGNREINQSHVEYLMKEIKENNLLFAKPIDVDKNFGVIDGQHRLMAAKVLGVEVYYNRHDSLKKADMITLNRAQKNWGQKDYLNYYCAQGFPEYIKLREFSKKNEIGVDMAISICDQWRSIRAGKRFRNGEFQFNESYTPELIQKAREIILMIKTKIGWRGYLQSALFFKSLCILISTHSIDFKTLKAKIEMQLPRLSANTNIKTYLEMLIAIYNYKSRSKLVSLEEIEI